MGFREKFEKNSTFCGESCLALSRGLGFWLPWAKGHLLGCTTGLNTRSMKDMADANRKSVTKLPFWLKAFANVERHSKDPLLKIEGSKPLLKIVEALKDKKSVVVLVDGEPTRITNRDGKIVFDTIQNPKFVVE